MTYMCQAHLFAGAGGLSRGGGRAGGALMSSEMSRKGSCAVEVCPQEQHMTSDCRIPPNTLCMMPSPSSAMPRQMCTGLIHKFSRERGTHWIGRVEHAQQKLNPH
jgi:hypothetical protein